MAHPEIRPEKLRRFRIAAYAVYLAVVGLFCTLLIVSVVRSVIAMTPRRLPGSDKVLTVPECVAAGEKLWAELDGRRQMLGAQVPAHDADIAWARFRVEWLQRHREAESMCAVDSKSRASLKAMFSKLDRVMDLYTTHAVQYSGEIGPSVDALRAAIEAARKGSTR